MAGQFLGVLEPSAVLLVDGDARCPERVIGVGGGEGSCLAAALDGSERIVDSPPDALANGDKVRIQAAGAGA